VQNLDPEGLDFGWVRRHCMIKTALFLLPGNISSVPRRKGDGS
jgi:hypothetical protein